MSLKTLRCIGLAAFLFGYISAGSAFAQDQSNSSAPANPAPSQDSTTAPGAGSASAPSGTAQAPTKRVWTNDDMGDLHQNSTISTFSGPAGKPAKSNGKPASTAKMDKDAKRYHDQITALQAKLPELDDKISQLKAVLSGDTVQSTRTYGGTRIDDWHEELVKLQKQREDIETKISSLQDEARHNGVPENQIPQ